MKTSIYEFMNELNSVVFGDYINTSFRYNSLLLIQKHFNVDIGAFVVYEENIAHRYAFKNHYLDNVVLGIPFKSLNEYYDYFHKLSVLNNAPQEDIIRLTDIVPIEEYEKSEYYIKYAKEYGYYYKIKINLRYKEQIIGSLTLVRTKEQGDFTDEEIEDFRKVRTLITAELIKCLMFERTTLENMALKRQAEVFPIAQVILDNDFNVIYYNEEALPMTHALVGDDPYRFKYLFINEVVTKNLLSEEKKYAEIQVDNYLIKVFKEVGKYDIALPREQVYYVVYITELLTTSSVKKSKYKSKLTKRENEVAKLIKQGLSNVEIAEALFISPFTVKTHTQSIYEKLGVNSKGELIHKLFSE